MTLVLLGAAVVMLTLPAFGRLVGSRLDPAEWARLLAAMLLVGFAALELALVLLALPTVLAAAGVPELASACRRLLGELAPGGISVGWSAAVLAVVLPVRAAWGTRAARRVTGEMHVEEWFGRHEARDGVEVVVLPAPHVLAYSVHATPAQVVISDGLVDTLAPDELAAVLRHELAHLRHGHQRYLVLAAALEHAVPFATPSTRPLRAALERWADEHASGASPERRASLRAALLRVTDAMVGAPPVAAFTTAGTVLERAAALEQPRVASSCFRRVVAYLTIASLAATVVAALVVWIAEAHMMLAMAGFCPM